MEFIYIIKPHKENFAETMTEEEAKIMDVHFEYLSEKLKQGKLIMAGPVLTGEFGIAVLETENEDEAKDIMNNDPSVIHGIMRPTLYPFRVSLLRGRDA